MYIKILICTLLLSVNFPSWAEKSTKAAQAKLIPDCPLTGTWKSHKKKTMPAINKNNGISLDVKARMADLFGKVTISYNKDCSQAKADVNGKISTLDFKVINSDKDSITVKDTKTNSLHVMRFDGDCYLMEVQGVGVDEYYCRVADKK
jgi:hypothetical protein